MGRHAHSEPAPQLVYSFREAKDRERRPSLRATHAVHQVDGLLPHGAWRSTRLGGRGTVQAHCWGVRPGRVWQHQAVKSDSQERTLL